MTMFKRRGLTLPFLAAICIFAATGLVGYRAVDALVQSQRNRAATRLIASELQNLLGLATQAETGQRGFVITGNDAYLEPYHDAKKRLPDSIARLRQALQGNQAELERLNRTEILQQQKIAELEESIQARRNAGFEAAQGIVLSNRGKALMDEIRANVRDIEAVEIALLDQRMAEVTQNAEQAYLTLVLSGMLNVAMLLFLARAVRADEMARSKFEQEMANSRALLNNILDNSPAAMYLLDPQGHLLLANKALLQYMSRSREQVIGKPASQLFAQEAISKQEMNNQVALRERKVVVFEESLHFNGSLRQFLTSRVPIYDNDGALVGICGVSSDISSLKQAEQEIRALNQTLEHRVRERTQELARVNLQLQQANRDLEAFSYTVAHDLRAPLRGVQGFSQAVIEDYGMQLDPAGQDYLRRIARAAGRMERLIEDLLTFSRLARAELPLEKVPLQEIVDQVLTDLSAQIAESKAHVEIVAALPSVIANRAACLQIVQNLLSNAIKFTQPGVLPVVQIKSDLPALADNTRQMARLWVIDHGIGIAPHQQEKIFLPFERLHSIEEYAGTGIGLAIVAKAVGRMHGACGVQSEPGRGSHFWIELPLALQEAQ